MSPFSPMTDMSVSSPDSPAISQQFLPLRPSPDSQNLRPTSMPASMHRPPSANFLTSPSDIVGPSPVTSTGTETTEIEDEEQTHPSTLTPSPQAQLMMLHTNIPDHLRHQYNEEAVSVIHAPESFKDWASNDSTIEPGTQSSKSSPRLDNIAIPSKDQVENSKSPGLPTPPPLTTDVRPVRYSLESSTPRAQDLREVQDYLSESSRIRSSSTSSLELIPELRETETDVEADVEEDDVFVSPASHREESEVRALKTALQECWTLCNTLATLSSIHRERVFNNSGTPDAHERAWKCCWKLCQRLYNNQDDDADSFDVRGNLDLCRDFCQALFDVRPRKDEVADSVLRVSFELNNHLYSAQDSRSLPEAFRERTLEFYITLCHRLMKQRAEFVEENDSLHLLRACWSLAEMLFSLRENRRKGKAPDEELLGSAVQACWELCDIFREGWTQVRPDRGTPRPSQMSFFAPGPSTAGEPTPRAVPASSRISNSGSTRSYNSKRDSLKSKEGHGHSHRKNHAPPVPETPVTEFEDTPVSPDGESPHIPNILVLGTSTQDSNRGGRWSSSASQLSSYSQSSAKTSSTATTATAGEDVNITRIKTLMLKAAMNVGFSRDNDGNSQVSGRSSKTQQAANLQSFVKALPTGSFGSLPSHAALLGNYKNLVLADNSFRTNATLPPKGKKVSAQDVAKSIMWMMLRSGQSTHYAFLKDLFKLVFGFHVEEAETKKTVSITV